MAAPAHSHDRSVTILNLLVMNGFADAGMEIPLLTRDPDVWNSLARRARGPNAHTWLHAAAALGHTQRVAFLCSHGVNARMEDIDTAVPVADYQTETLRYGSMTALGWAAAGGHADTVAFLIARGA